MKIERIKVADLKHAEKNTRIHNSKQIAELVRSLNMFGQIRPAVVDEQNVVWCGNGMVEAARKAGWTEIDVYRVVGLTDAQKKKLMLADNQTFLLGATNTSVMDEILTELQDFDVPGFDEETLSQLYGAIDEATEELKNYGTINQDAVQQLERAESRMSAYEDAQVYTRDDAQAMREAPSAASGDAPTPPVDLPPAIESVNGMLNVPANKNERPFILCPKCGEKIYV